MKPALDADGCLDISHPVRLCWKALSKYPSLAAYRRAVAASQGLGNKSKARRALQ